MSFKIKILFIVLIILLILLLFFYLGRNQETTIETPSWRGLVPGVSTEDDLYEKIGVPDFGYYDPNNENLLTVVYELDSDATYSRNAVEIYVPNKIIRYIQLSIDESFIIETEKELLEKYGEPEKKIATGHSHWSTKYIYPNQGLAYVVDGSHNPTEPKIILKFLFKPMNLESFEEFFQWKEYKWPSEQE